MKFGLHLAKLAQQYPRARLIKNLEAELVIIQVGGANFPISVAKPEQKNNTWTVSFTAMVLDYGKEELHKLTKWKCLLLTLLLFVLKLVFRALKIDNLIGVDNACLSTNLISQDLKEVDLPLLRQIITKDYPRSSLMIRSLNEYNHADFLKKLRQDGWQLLVNRQIYLIADPEVALKKRDSKRDLKLLDDPNYHFRALNKDSSDDEFEAVITLYNQLYLEKYSRLNVQFSAFLLKKMLEESCLQLYLLEDRFGQAKGCLGMVQEAGTLTVPILGYDLEEDRQSALYRRLSIFITDYCVKYGLQQHLSAGAPDFKKNRGAQPFLEYTAIYSQHLSSSRKIFWKTLAFLSRHFYAHLLKKTGL